MKRTLERVKEERFTETLALMFLGQSPPGYQDRRDDVRRAAPNLARNLGAAYEVGSQNQVGGDRVRIIDPHVGSAGAGYVCGQTRRSEPVIQLWPAAGEMPQIVFGPKPLADERKISAA